MEVIFDNGESLQFAFLDSPVTSHYKNVYKHLQHVPFDFNKWDMPNYDKSQAHNDLEKFATLLDITLDPIKLNDQNYFNYLHSIYENNYNGSEHWLSYHEQIHLCESLLHNGDSSGFYHIDWREKGGMLTGKFNNQWITDLQNTVKAGQIFFRWSELGKIPYTYWKNCEPDSIERLCELAKPMLHLRPKVQIAVKKLNFIPESNIEKFSHWWKKYHDEWCAHWNLQKWPIEYMFGVIPYAETSQVDILQKLVEQKSCPVKIRI